MAALLVALGVLPTFAGGELAPNQPSPGKWLMLLAGGVLGAPAAPVLTSAGIVAGAIGADLRDSPDEDRDDVSMAPELLDGGTQTPADGTITAAEATHEEAEPGSFDRFGE
jgi:hypothetical protein